MYAGLNILLLWISILGDISRLSILINALATLSNLVTTVSTTFLVALKIVLATRQSHMRRSYSKTIEIIIESGTLPSTIFLYIVITGLVDYIRSVDLSTPFGTVVYMVGDYLVFCQGLIAVRIIPPYIHHSLL